ncbi:MAG: hypothetical protein K6G89_00785 [Clostridia bacterium]|nr:hypothetical protein [Clostridia bacterium]
MGSKSIGILNTKLCSKALYVDPGQWGAVDALGRRLPSAEETGPARNKFVGLFYWTWHTSSARRFPARNVTEIISRNPEAVNDFDHPCWEQTGSGTPYFWGKPIYGYYDDHDEFVVRKNAELIADAGIDVIFFDTTNGDFLWTDEYLFLADVYKNAITQGLRVPKFAFMLNFWPAPTSRTMLRNVYKDFYSKPENECLFFYWEGKPLIMAHPDCLDPNDPLDKEILGFFTFRRNEPTYFAADTPYKADEPFGNYWGWCSVYPQTKYGVKEDGTVEQMTVNVAQNANDQGLHAMNSNGGKGVYGRSYAKGDYSYTYDKYGVKTTVSADTPELSLYGRNFQQQWDYALKVDPEFIFVTGWNELIAGRFDNWEGTDNAFPDQYDYEHSRDCEPTSTILGDNYYYQLCANVRRYKGIDSDPKPIVKKTVEIGGDASQWKDVTSEFAAYSGSTLERDAVGWVGDKYYQPKAPNEILLTKCAYDDENLYFMCECAGDIKTGCDAFMKLLITTPAADADSFEGFDYMVSPAPRTGKAAPERIAKGFRRSLSGEFGKVSVRGNLLELSVSRKAVGLDCKGKPSFGFKWCDANLQKGDILDVYTKGNAVPAGRFFFKV